MIEKEKRSSEINSLRIINNFDTDYNLLLKVYWPKITNRITEENNTLRKNKLGTQKINISIHSAMVNEFIIDIFRIQQYTIAIQ